MKKLLDNDFFKTLKDSLIYVERTQADGRIRKGLIGIKGQFNICRKNTSRRKNKKRINRKGRFRGLFICKRFTNTNQRKGLIGKVDLEDYSFAKDSQTLIRATEGTVLERIPPRVRVRENAPLELPHIMLLIDDDKKQIIEELANE